MLQPFFHAGERHLAPATTDRVVRPFEWGLEWIPSNAAGSRSHHRSKVPPDEVLGTWVAHVMADTDAFFTPEPTSDYALGRSTPDADRLLTFPSALATPHRENNTVHCRLFPAGKDGGRRAGERGPGWSRGPLRGACEERDDRAASQPAVSRSADASGAAPCRLHRERERRAHGTGVPPGGARRAARHPVARARGLRAHRDSRNESRFLSGAPHDGPRAN